VFGPSSATNTIRGNTPRTPGNGRRGVFSIVGIVDLPGPADGLVVDNWLTVEL
jgi:hypothetical protein